MTSRLLRIAACVLLLGGLLGSGAAAGELSESAWADARKQAAQLMDEPGQRFAKLKVIDALGRDDSMRAADLLVRWTMRSLKLQQGKLHKQLEGTRKAFEKIDALMRRAYGTMPPTQWRNGADQRAWMGPKREYEEAQRLHGIEGAVRFRLGEALQHVRNTEAITFLLKEGLPALQNAHESELIQVAIVRAVFRQPKLRVLRTAFVLARAEDRPKVRILAINWFGRNQVREGYVVVEAALRASEVAVRRAAVMALRTLDDSRAVRPLIAAMQQADGQLRVEIDEVLFHFTGKSFEGAASVWQRWWDREGEAWVAGKSTERFRREPKQLPGGTRVRFYGIPTESHHVVFVLDRSGSMKDPAGAKKPPNVEPPIEGNTKIAVAKNQLARSIDQLDKRVKFNVVFYSNDLRVWKKPPALLESTKANKEAAKTWFRGLAAQGPTLLFPALLKALEYADTIRAGEKRPRTGADTIFLLSDGSPTTADGQTLAPEELETQYRQFLEANQLYHCIVHTIGVGPHHNSTLLRRLARDTGGEYKAVGAE